MWRRIYLLLLLVRIYFAFSPSYLHPDENFQGPEIFAGRIFSYPTHLAWEFTSDHPIRSVFPLWPVYGIPMTLLKWGWGDGAPNAISSDTVYYVLRALMFLLSFVLEDWAIYELVASPRHRSEAVVLVASSYVTWTYQTHTFSNSVETLLVLWSLVLIDRIVENQESSSAFANWILGFLVVMGVFNRITFPAFLIFPALSLLPHFGRTPLSLIVLLLSIGFFAALAITVDSTFYGPQPLTLSHLLQYPTITPWNNLRYNIDSANLALHGLHPRHQHVVVNLPQLLGPAIVLLFRLPLSALVQNRRLLSAVSATAILSVFPHQEPRFLLPCIPLLLTCIRTPRSWLIGTIQGRIFVTAWILFNAVLGTLMGSYHQAGVIPTQMHLRSVLAHDPNMALSNGPAHAYWWKTYPPPTYLTQNASLISTHDLQGMPYTSLLEQLSTYIPPCSNISLPLQIPPPPQDHPQVYLVAPLSATQLDFLTGPPPPPKEVSPLTSSVSANEEDKNDSPTTQEEPKSDNDAGADADSDTDTDTNNSHAYSDISIDTPTPDPYPEQNNINHNRSPTISLAPQFHHTKHIGLDDLDPGEKGLWNELRRVVGRRGLGVWKVERRPCF